MDITITGVLIRLVLGLVIGFCMGLTGVGGGVLVVPSLTVILGLPASVAVGTAGLYGLLTRIYATVRHAQSKNIDFRISAAFLSGALPGTIIVSWLINNWINRASGDALSLLAFQSGLKVFIASVVLMSAIVLVVNLIVKSRKDAGGKESVSGRLDRHPSLRRFLAVVLGLMVGSLVGSTSVGGGVIIVPVLIVIFGIEVKRTVGSSIFITLVLVFAQSIIYGGNSQVDYVSAVIMAAGALSGVHWGSKLAIGMPERMLQGIVIVIVFLAAVFMLTA